MTARVRPEYSDDGGTTWYVMCRDEISPVREGKRRYRVSWDVEGRYGCSPELPDGFSIVSEADQGDW